MAHLYIMCGLAFSGKSTLSRKIAEYIGAKRIAFDEIWVAMIKENQIPKGSGGWKLVRKIAFEEVVANLKKGISVIYDDNNPRFEHRDEFRKVAEKFGFKTTVIYLNTPMEVIRKREVNNRITQHRHDVESINFDKVASDLEVPTDKENYIEFTPETNLNEFLQKLDKN